MTTISNPLAFHLIYLRNMEHAFTTKLRTTFMKSHLSLNINLAKDCTTLPKKHDRKME